MAYTSQLTFSKKGMQSYAVKILDDSVAEDTESFVITLSNPQPAAAVVLSSDRVNITVIDNDGGISVLL